MGVLGVTAFWSLCAEGGYRVSLNVFNFAFLFLALLLHPSPASFTRAAARGAGYLHGIVIQFPFYAGMYGLIRYSGLAEIIGRWFVSIATPRTFPVIIYWYSGILSYFIPSGGSKWAVEAPCCRPREPASQPARRMAYAWGDMSTHFLQPFWPFRCWPSHGGIMTSSDILPSCSSSISSWSLRRLCCCRIR